MSPEPKDARLTPPKITFPEITHTVTRFPIRFKWLTAAERATLGGYWRLTAKIDRGEIRYSRRLDNELARRRDQSAAVLEKARQQTVEHPEPKPEG